MKQDVFTFNPRSYDAKLLECVFFGNTYVSHEQSILKNTLLTESHSFNFPAKGGFLNFSFLVDDAILGGFCASGTGGLVQQNKNKL